MPTVTSHTLDGESRSAGAAALKPPSMVCALGLLRDHHLQAVNTYFPVGATFFGPFTNTQIDFVCLPASVRVHRCCALHLDGYRSQLAAAPERRDHRPTECIFRHRLSFGAYERRHGHQWYKNNVLQAPIFAQHQTTCLAQVEDAAR